MRQDYSRRSTSPPSSPLVAAASCWSTSIPSPIVPRPSGFPGEIEYSTIDLLLDPPRERMTRPRRAQTWEVVQGLRLLPSTVSLARAEAPGGGLIEARIATAVSPRASSLW